MANILVLPSEVVGEAESGNSYAFPADNIIMSDKATSVEEAINNKPGEKIPGTEEDSVGGEIFNDYTNNIASGKYSHAEGTTATASGYSSHAEGDYNVASGYSSHAEGSMTTASGLGSHAEGVFTKASGDGSHVEGGSTEASGAYAYAGGYMTKASGVHSHAEGTGTIAASDAQHVQGKYNIEDSKGVYAHIVGWGTSSRSRANIHTITTGGDGWFAGKVSAGTVETPSNPTEANDLITKKYFDENSGSGVGQSYPNEVDEETNPVGAPGEIFNVYEDDESSGVIKNIASGGYSHAEGATTTASGIASHAEGVTTTASGIASHVEGADTTASGAGSHAEGSYTTASDTASHAEGAGTTASGAGSHAEGADTTASGTASHAEGAGTTASGEYSHAEGLQTIASADCQHVQGKYNVEDTEGAYAHIIGGGSSNSNRKNIHTVDWDGNAYFEGRVMVSENSAIPTLPNELVTMNYINTLISGSKSGEQNFLSDPVLFPLTIDQTIQNDFTNITKLPDGYTAGNTLILSVIDIPNSVVYFGSSSYDFIIRITEDGHIQLRFINSAVDSERQFYVLLCKFSLPTATSILELFNNNNIN